MTGYNNTIGGLDPNMRNIISGNTVSGISVSAIPGAGPGTTIIGNFIGTDPTGTESRANAFGEFKFRAVRRQSAEFCLLNGM